MDIDRVVLVDENDRGVGYEEKEGCHRLPAKLHRAFSIFIVDYEGLMLIHRRALTKKTWPGFWSNACCSHPRIHEEIGEAAQRRLQEEMGFSCPLEEIFTFRYKADYDGEFGENEVDHVFVGEFSGMIRPNKEEVEDWRYISLAELEQDATTNPDKYTPWFKIALPDVLKHLRGHLPLEPQGFTAER
jgi:isopentenyl-diphosphate Delta-isomerase